MNRLKKEVSQVNDRVLLLKLSLIQNSYWSIESEDSSESLFTLFTFQASEMKLDMLFEN